MLHADTHTAKANSISLALHKSAHIVQHEKGSVPAVPEGVKEELVEANYSSFADAIIINQVS